MSIEGGACEAWGALGSERLNKTNWVTGVVSSGVNPETPDRIISHNDTGRNQ